MEKLRFLYEGSYSIQSSTIKSDDLLKKEQRAKDSDSFSLEIRLKKGEFVCFRPSETIISHSPLVRKPGSFAEAAERFETWGGGGGHLYTAMHIPMVKFPKMPFALFLGTRKPLCNLHSVFCGRNPFLTMHL